MNRNIWDVLSHEIVDEAGTERGIDLTEITATFK